MNGPLGDIRVDARSDKGGCLVESMPVPGGRLYMVSAEPGGKWVGCAFVPDDKPAGRLVAFTGDKGDPLMIDPRVVRGLRGDASALGLTAIDYVVGAQYISAVVRGSPAEVAKALGLEVRQA